MISDAAAVLEKIYAYRASQWGTPAERYKGSQHEAAVEAAARDPTVMEEKAWRRSMKKTYPTMKRDQLEAMLRAAVDEGLPAIDLDSAFARYRREVVAAAPARAAAAVTSTA